MSDSAAVLQVAFLDVGQGDAALVQLPGPVNVLIDGGPSGAGPRVLEALEQSGVRKLDWVIGSHPHEDHIGGLMDVLPEVPVARLLDPAFPHTTALYKKYLQLIRDKGIRPTAARAGQTYDLGSGARLEILAPETPLLTGTESDANNNSIVARLVFGSTRFLFTGDMEEDERARLLQSASPAQLQADVLKVAHHGSHNGTDPDFLRAVQPRYAVISLARNNDYGHPHREPLQMLQSQGVPVLRTDERGTVVFTSDGRTLTLVGGQASGTVRTPAQPDPGRTAPATGGRVVGNSTSRVYHRPNCRALPGPSNRTEFGSAGAAESAGYRAHKACMQGGV